MMKLLAFKEKMKDVYRNNSMYLIPLTKFVASFVFLLVMNSYIGYSSIIKNILIEIIVAAVSAVLPVNIIVLLMSIMMLVDLYALAPEIALITLMIMLVMYILYFRFSSKYGYILLLMPVLFFFKMPYIMPLIIGIASIPSAIVAMIFGTVIFYIMKYSALDASSVVNRNSDTGISKVSNLLDKMLKNKEMMLVIVVFVLVACLVYFINRMSADHSMIIALFVGGITELIILICASYIMKLDEMDPIWVITLFSIISIGITYLIHYFILTVDYSRTEYAQFEDDDYYYYVKAVPKIKVAATDVKVKHINVKKAKRK